MATMMLTTSMVMMNVAVLVTIGNGNEPYCPSGGNADRDTMVVGLMVRKKMMEVLMVINIVMIMMDVHSDYVRTYGDDWDDDADADGDAVGWPLGPGWLARWTRMAGRLVSVGCPVSTGWLAGWSMLVSRLAPGGLAG